MVTAQIKAFIRAVTIQQPARLLNMPSDNHSKISAFYEHLANHKKLFTKNRDSGFYTFLKGLGVVGATILGVGIGGYYTYKAFFPSEDRHMNKMINKVPSQTPKRYHIKQC